MYLSTTEKMALVMIFISLSLLVYVVGVHLLTQNDCLKQGYPEYKVSVTLDRYCLDIEGAVTTKVERQ